MKLNPPETAPKDELILALFGQVKYLYPAVWNDRYGIWEFAVRAYAPRGNGSQVEAEEEWDNELTGWLPMPQIDDEGDVI